MTRNDAPVWFARLEYLKCLVVFLKIPTSVVTATDLIVVGHSIAVVPARRSMPRVLDCLAAIFVCRDDAVRWDWED